jgi:hypothetical protein
VFCGFNPKIFLWVNVILNVLVFYVNELVFIVFWVSSIVVKLLNKVYAYLFGTLEI